MNIFATCMCVVVTVVSASPPSAPYDNIQQEFEAFKTLHNKRYEHEIVEKFRMKIYENNKHAVDAHNARYEKGLETYQVALNQYSDLLHHEFQQRNTGYKRDNQSEESSYPEFSSVLRSGVGATPDSMDWRDKGAVTDVKSQGNCDACFAFSATGALEAQHFLKSGKLVSLSEQNLLDCMPPGQNCQGGFMAKAYDYIKSNGGIDTEDSYAYEGADGKCRFKKENVGATCTGYVKIPKGDEQKLKEAVATVGPVCVAIDSTQAGFRHYSNGVHYDKGCGEPTHAVLVVGYGTSDKGEAYWLVKNSWGTDWGIKGYIMMARDRDNNCGIATDAVYPTV